jgi:hypothetical protein
LPSALPDGIRQELPVSEWRLYEHPQNAYREEAMKKRFPLLVFVILLLIALLAGCALRNAATNAALLFPKSQTGVSVGAQGPSQAGAGSSLGVDPSGWAAATMALAPADESAASGTGSSDSGNTAGGTPLIIKQGQIHLLVKDTDQSIDRLTQIVSDSGGYIVSNRVWLQPYQDANYKYATYTIAVPADQFESALLRLRDLSLRVVDESAGGQDVSEEYVDLQSRLNNLESTAGRIRGFLDQAQTVDESLRINQELSTIEDQIEQVKGRMNYLSNRAAYSTITVQLDPDLPSIVVSTPAPAGWDPGRTFEKAGGLAVKAAQFLVDLAIYLAVWLPFAVPVLIVWIVYRILASKRTTA